jgi:hypothetical protein
MTCLLVALSGGIALAAITPDLLLAGVVLAATGTGLTVGRTGPAVPMLAGAAVLMVAALAVLMRRDTFDSARLPRH